jgi:hypothetical protein
MQHQVNILYHIGMYNEKRFVTKASISSQI